jgi:HEAT repeat protein
LTAFRSELAAVALGDALVEVRPGAELSIEDKSTLLGVAYAEPTGVAAARVIRTLAATLERDDEPAADRAGALLELFPVESVGPLVRTLRTARAPAARRRAARSLHVCRHDDAVGALVGALTDKAPEVRVAAAESLGEIRDPLALEPLSAASADPDRAVRQAAQSAAAALGVVARAAGVAAALVPRDDPLGA